MITNRERRYILLALRESLASNYGRVQIGAVLVSGNYVVSGAANQNKPHPMQYKYNIKANRPPSEHKIHAEIHALVKSKSFDLTGSTAYVGRLDRNGAMAMCRPCKACRLALRDAGVSTIVFTTPEGIKREELK